MSIAVLEMMENTSYIEMRRVSTPVLHPYEMIKAAFALPNCIRKETSDIIITPDIKDQQTRQIIPGFWGNGETPNHLQLTLQRNYPQEAQ
ncbi:hypothetical protein ABEB36_003689 [Hypothenemus hampei]|uniref:Uncharacterized protein n=1 Tax=Hypothenemus hampei TaxID=57062 RepID=A0ABD1F169_HYPHA